MNMYENEYKEYGYNDKVPLIDKCSQMYDYLEQKFNSIGHIDTDVIENTITNTIENSLGDINCKFCTVNKNINRAKKEIIEEVQEIKTPCLCHLATKEDVRQAVKDINEHTDEKFNEINFIEKFSDLNQQVRELKDKLV